MKFPTENSGQSFSPTHTHTHRPTRSIRSFSAVGTAFAKIFCSLLQKKRQFRSEAKENWKGLSRGKGGRVSGSVHIPFMGQWCNLHNRKLTQVISACLPRYTYHLYTLPASVASFMLLGRPYLDTHTGTQTHTQTHHESLDGHCAEQAPKDIQECWHGRCTGSQNPFIFILSLSLSRSYSLSCESTNESYGTYNQTNIHAHTHGWTFIGGVWQWHFMLLKT